MLEVGLAGGLELEPEPMVPWLQDLLGFDRVPGAADVVVDIAQLAALDIQRIPAGGGPLAEQDAFGAISGDLDLGGDAVGRFSRRGAAKNGTDWVLAR